MSTTMSCPCPPPHHRRKTAAPLDLLDEYWFFSNTLANTNKPPPSPSKDRHGTSTSPRFDVASESGGRRLLRTPSLPPPRPRRVDDHQQPAAVQQKEEEDPEVDDDDLNWSSIYEGVLRTRMEEGGRRSGPPALRRAPSMPVPSSAVGNGAKPAAPRSTTARNKSSVFQEKKWRSSSDLESIKVRVHSSEARSAAEMKDQLRMWAQAVACNVRQDC